MDLLVEKGDSRTYLSRYKVITTSFEESSPSVKRNNTQIQYRNGNVDFGGWHEAKIIDYVGYYRADDIGEEEALREKIYALLSDPDGYYITQLKNDNDDSYERPGENTGDYFEKQVNRPSHKRFYVYASSLESELVGSYGGHVLYKISAKFTTIKLPYGESVPRNLDIKSNLPYIGNNLLTNTGNLSANWGFNGTIDTSQNPAILHYPTKTITSSANTIASQQLNDGLLQPSTTYTASFYAKGKGTFWFYCYANVSNGAHADTQTYIKLTSDYKLYTITFTTVPNISGNKNLLLRQEYSSSATDQNTVEAYIYGLKLEKGSLATQWNPAPSDTEYNEWYANTYYNTKNLVIPYAGTVACNQLEQGFTVEFTAKEGGSNLKLNVNGTELTYNGQVYNGDVIKLSGYEYTKNDISIVKTTNKAYFKLVPGVSNTISSNLHGSIKILGFQDLYA